MQDDAMQVQDGRSGLATVAAYACFESIQANAVVAEADALGFGVCYCCCCCWPNPMQGRDRNSQRWARHVPGRWRNGGGGRVGGVERGMQSGGMGWDGDGQDGLGWRRSRCGANVTNNLSPVMTAAGKGVGCVGAGGSRLSYAIRMDAGTYRIRCRLSGRPVQKVTDGGWMGNKRQAAPASVACGRRCSQLFGWFRKPLAGLGPTAPSIRRAIHDSRIPRIQPNQQNVAPPVEQRKTLMNPVPFAGYCWRCLAFFLLVLYSVP